MIVPGHVWKVLGRLLGGLWLVFGKVWGTVLGIWDLFGRIVGGLLGPYLEELWRYVRLLFHTVLIFCWKVFEMFAEF